MTDSPFDAAGNLAGSWARILSDIAHDVRGAAGATDMWLELVGRAREDADRERAIRELRRSVTRTVRLAEDLADASALIRGAAPGPGLPLDLATVIAAARERLEPEARGRSITLEFTVPDPFTHPIVGDAEAWERNLVRIIAAAMAHATRGQPLSVSVGQGKDPANALELAVPSGELRLAGELSLLESWAVPRPSGATFPLGLCLARAFLERAGGRLELRDGPAGRQLVAVMP